MARTQTEAIGFADMVLSMLLQECAALEEGGLNVEKMTATLKRLLDEAIRANTDQEECKRHALESTTRSNAATRMLDTTASSYLDMAMGAVNKTSDVSKVMARLRSEIRRGRRVGSPPTVDSAAPTEG